MIKLIGLSIISYFISGVIHELGHIIVGIMQGFKFYILVIGPFGLKRDSNGKICFYIENNMHLWGGVGGTIPIVESTSNVEKFAKILLGGPFVSIVFGAVVLPFGLLLDNIFLVLLGAMQLGMGVACLIPTHAGAFYTDGGRWLRIHRESTKPIEVAILNIEFNAVINGENYANINIKDVNSLINNVDPKTIYLGHYFLCRYYKDKNDMNKFYNERDNLKLLANQVPKQMVSIFSVE